MNDREAVEYKPMDMHDLYLALDRFWRDNKSSGNLERRWLASHVAPTKNLVAEFKMNGIKNLSEEHQQSLREFRLQEIEAAKARLAREADALDQEARKLQQPKTRAA